MNALDRNPQQLLATALAALCLGYFALWACAPAATIRPNLPMQQGQSIGIGASGATGLINRDACRDVTLSGDAQSCTSGQLWVHVQPSDWFSFGVVGFAGDVNGVGVGPYARLHLLNDPLVRIALDAQLGVAWAAVGLPIAGRLSDQIWVYTEPSIGVRSFNAARLPAGVAVDLGFVRVHGEVGVGTGSGNGDLVLDRDKLIGYGSAGVEFTF